MASWVLEDELAVVVSVLCVRFEVMFFVCQLARFGGRCLREAHVEPEPHLADLNRGARQVGHPRIAIGQGDFHTIKNA